MGSTKSKNIIVYQSNESTLKKYEEIHNEKDSTIIEYTDQGNLKRIRYYQSQKLKTEIYYQPFNERLIDIAYPAIMNIFNPDGSLKSSIIYHPSSSTKNLEIHIDKISVLLECEKITYKLVEYDTEFNLISCSYKNETREFYNNFRQNIDELYNTSTHKDLLVKLRKFFNITNTSITNITPQKATSITTCTTCLENKPNYIITPCGHPHMCSKCHQKWLTLDNNKECPLCKQKIENYIQVYL